MKFSRLDYWRGLPFPSSHNIMKAQSCLTLCEPMDCSLPGSSLHGIFQARILEWVALSFSGGSSLPRDQTQVSCIAGRPICKFYTYIQFPVCCSIYQKQKKSESNGSLKRLNYYHTHGKVKFLTRDEHFCIKVTVRHSPLLSIFHFGSEASLPSCCIYMILAF